MNNTGVKVTNLGDGLYENFEVRVGETSVAETPDRRGIDDDGEPKNTARLHCTFTP